MCNPGTLNLPPGVPAIFCQQAGLSAELVKDPASESDETVVSNEDHDLGLEAPAVIHVITRTTAQAHIEVVIAETGFCGCTPNGLSRTSGPMDEAERSARVRNEFAGLPELVVRTRHECEDP